MILVDKFQLVLYGTDGRDATVWQWFTSRDFREQSRRGVFLHVLSLQLRDASGGIRVFTRLHMLIRGWFTGKFIAFVA